MLFINSSFEPTRGCIIHLIDACIRYSRRGVSTKDEWTLITRITELWLSVFGAPKVLVLEQEAGLRGDLAMQWAQKWGLHLAFKAPRQKAWIVERHNEIIRHGVHRTESQMMKEGINMPFEAVLGMVTFMKNALTNINGSTPHQGAFGDQPQCLPPLERGITGQYDDRSDARLRELAAQNIIEASAQQRLKRADKHNTRPALEKFAYKPGDLVDIWFEPQTKDHRGWRGPATVSSATLRRVM